MTITEQLKQQEAEWVGGELVDVDAPDAPTPIVGFRLTSEWFAVVGRDFTWEALREELGFTTVEDRLCLTVPGLACTIRKPEAPHGYA